MDECVESSRFHGVFWRCFVGFALIAFSALTAVSAADTGCPGLAKLIELDSHGLIGDLGVSGSLLVAAESGYGITTWSLDDPDHPIRLGSWASPTRIFHSGSGDVLKLRLDARGFAFVGSRDWKDVWAFDLRVPDHPKPLWNSETMGDFGISVYDFDMRNRLLAVVGSKDRLFDVADPMRPILIGDFSSHGHAYSKVVLVGSYAVTWRSFSSIEDGVDVFEISDPSDLRRIASFDLDQHYSIQQQALWAGDDLVLLTGEYFFAVLDVSDPSGPTLHHLDNLGRWEYIRDIAWKGRTLYASVYSTSGSRTEIIDFTDPANPILVDVADNAGILVNGGERLYSSDGRSIDAHSFAAGLPVLGGTSPGGAVEKVAFYGDIAVVADGYRGIVTLDVSDVENSEELGSFEAGDYADDVVVGDGIAFVAASDRGLQIIDITNPTLPVLLASMPFDKAWEIALDGDLVLLACGRSGDFGPYSPEWLQIIDVSDPSQPEHLASVGGFQNGWHPSVAAENGVAYFASANKLLLIDLSEPRRPNILSTIELGYERYQVRDVAVSGHLVLATIPLIGLAIVDVSHPSTPELIQEVNVPAYGVSVDGTTAYVNGGAKLSVIDFSDPYNLEHRTISTKRPMWGATPHNNHVFLASPPYLEILSLECQPPVASFEFESSAFLVQFTNTSKYFWDEIHWDLGDGTVITDMREPLHYYEIPGAYDVELHVASEFGESTTISTVVVSESSRADFLAVEMGGER